MPKAPKGKSDHNTGILEYALSHLEREYAEIQAKIEHVKHELGLSAKSMVAAVAALVEDASPAAAAPAAAGTRKKRVLSPAARKRIALAQKRRWAEHRKAKGAKA